MKKIITAVFATAILATGPLAISTDTAEAKCKGWKCNFGKGVATGVGIGVGAAITNHVLRPREPEVVIIEREPRYVAPPPPAHGYSARHYNWCQEKYRSYDVPSNTYQPYRKPHRQQCRSPWG